MTFPAADTLNLIPEVLELRMTITRGGGWALGLAVTDEDDVGLDLTGKTATITLPNGDVWTAAIVGSQFVWDVPKATIDALTFQVGTGTLTVNDGSRFVVWAKGKVTVV